MAGSAYIQHLQAFRGVAILAIVGAHAWSFAIFWTGGLNAPGLDQLFAATETLFHGSTLYFSVISGLLFSQVLQRRGWQRFFHSKATNVLLPYVVVSLAMTALFWEYLAGQDPQANFVSTFAWGLLMGKASIHLWYMPVLLVLFSFTPLLVALLAHRRGRWLVWLLMVAPLVISRSPFPDFIKLQTFVYFAGAYAIGLVAGAYYDGVQQSLASYWRWLALMALATSIAIYVGYGADAVAWGVFNLRQSLVYVQKLSLCFLLLYGLRLWEARLPSWLLILGDYAFAVYFLHATVLGYLINWSVNWLQDERSVVLLGVFGGVGALTCVLVSLLLALCVRALMGRHSRKLIGA